MHDVKMSEKGERQVAERASIDLIIPVFNSRQFMPGMLESIERQTYKDFRVIFVDDGSSDGTYEWLEETLKAVSFRYLLLSEKNRGPSAARNLGMKNADADWIVFSDSDDVLSDEYFEYLYKSVESGNVQMGFCRLETVKPGGQPRRREREELSFEVISAAEAMKKHYTNWIAPVSLILNREWVAANGLMFDEKCRYCEDLIFITDCIDAAERVSGIKNDLYINIIRSTSLLRTGGTLKYREGIEAFERLEERMKKSNTAAAAEFRCRGRARFVLATFRRAALQLDSFKDFKSFTKEFHYENCSRQAKNLSKKWQTASRLYSVSKLGFYLAVRAVFSD